MQNMAIDEEPDKTTSLIQVGFGFQDTDPCALFFHGNPTECTEADGLQVLI